MFRVFVYGSLMTGFGNNRLLEDSRLISPAETLPNYEMVSFGAFPGVIPGGSTRIIGELWEVDVDTLERLDDLESNGRFYTREIRNLAGPLGTAWIYLLPREHLDRPRVVSGDWREYAEKNRGARWL